MSGPLHSGDSLIGITVDHGRYEIVKLIGEGGMGRVFQARQVSMNRMVALKLLRAQLATDDHLLARFQQEAHAVSKLRHPNTIIVYDYGKTEDGYLFIAMELLGGRSLASILSAEQRLTPLRALHIIEQVAGAVAEAHQFGIVHRDLKPENIQIDKVANDPDFAKQLAANFGIYVNDAFSAAHRAHASTEGVAHILPAYAGKQMERELDALDAALGKPKRPVLGIVGGAKVSTKLDLLKNLIAKLDKLAIGGGMANTFLYAQGHDIGGSLAEKEMADTARAIMKAAEGKCEILLPVDVVVASEVKPGVASRTCGPDGVGAEDKILDAGPETVGRLIAAMDQSATLIWNGPLGVFEIPPFDKATVEAAKHAAALVKAGKLVAVAGGGDTVAALNHAGVVDDMTFVSTAGGAFLEWMEGKALPGVEALRL